MNASLGKPIQVVFVGSCTNGRLSDLELAARVLKGRKVARGVRMLVVPGSQQVKREAEARGLAKMFTDAGAEWRESGCSMCIGMNGDVVAKGEYAVSTSNRNFEGRQGAGARTLLASPATAAAAAITGKITDPRDFLADCNQPSPIRAVMQPIRTIESRTVVLPFTNIDTDQIIPARFLTTTTQRGSRPPGVRRLALRRDAARRSPISSSTSRKRRIARSWSPGATSAAAPRASMRPGRCSTMAFAPSSAPRSPTSFAATR